MEEIVEILVEEISMERFLRVILPQLLPEKFILDQNCFIRPHEGKSHLQKSIPKKVRAFKGYTNVNVKLIIIHDQDANDCIALKNDLINLIEEANPSLPKLIRIACRELENWYLGDLNAIEQVYPDSRAKQLKSKARFRNCDNLTGSEEMGKLSANFTKSFASREIPKYMSLDENHSISFNHFLNGIRSFLDQ
ncbi:MAG: DUF4276 family protein [Cyclobacteriaceae bacterium]